MKKYSLALLFITITSAVYAKDEKIKHDAHEHGVAEINIVWEKADLNIELLSPAFNITGFEYQPANHDQEEAIAKIEKRLDAPNELFSISGASCKAVKTEIESPFEEHADHKKHEGKEEHNEHAKHDDHDEHKDHDEHDEHKDEEKHAKHDDHKDHDEHESSTHSEYSINYEFSCANSKSELSIDTANLFKHFPNMEKIKVQWLSTTQQSSAILTKKSNTITLK